jgi:putative hydrolase
MKAWRQYRNYLLKGQWHVHTNYVDGKNQIAEYCQEAIKRSIPLLAFTEHVRNTLSYDFNKFLQEIEKARENFSLIILSGCEAKVLADGSLDASKDILESVDYPIFAFHSFPKEAVQFPVALRKAIENPYVNAWAHPYSYIELNRKNLEVEEIEEILKLMKDNDVLLECNSKHGMLPQKWVSIADKIGVPIVWGSDIHSVSDLCLSGNSFKGFKVS